MAPTTTTSPSTSVSERMLEVPGALRFGRRSILGLPSRANSPLHKITKSPADSLCVHGRETTEERRSADQAACSPASLNIKFFRSVWRRCRFTGRHAAAWTTRRENTTYAYFGARITSSRISRFRSLRPPGGTLRRPPRRPLRRLASTSRRSSTRPLASRYGDCVRFASRRSRREKGDASMAWRCACRRSGMHARRGALPSTDN